MDNKMQRAELEEIMQTIDDCLDEIKNALDKLDFEAVIKLLTLLTEVFIAVNEFVDSRNHEDGDEIISFNSRAKIKAVNEALDELLKTFDNHDMEIRVNSYEQLRNSMLSWTGYIYNILNLKQ